MNFESKNLGDREIPVVTPVTCLKLLINLICNTSDNCSLNYHNLHARIQYLSPFITIVCIPPSGFIHRKLLDFAMIMFRATRFQFKQTQILQTVFFIPSFS